MQDLADATGGSINSYVSTDILTQNVENSVNTSYPENVSVSIAGKEIYFFPGEMNLTNSPKMLEIQDAINQYLEVCSAPNCEIPLEFESSNEGSLQGNS